MNGAGDAVVAWQRASGRALRQASLRPRGGALLGAARRSARPGFDVFGMPQAAIDGAGDAVVVWQRPDGSTPNTLRAGRDPAGRRLVRRAADAVGDRTRVAVHPQVAMNAAGDAVVAWTHARRSERSSCRPSCARPEGPSRSRSTLSEPASLVTPPRRRDRRRRQRNRRVGADTAAGAHRPGRDAPGRRVAHCRLRGRRSVLRRPARSSGVDGRDERGRRDRRRLDARRRRGQRDRAGGHAARGRRRSAPRSTCRSPGRNADQPAGRDRRRRQRGRGLVALRRRDPRRAGGDAPGRRVVRAPVDLSLAGGEARARRSR